MYELSTLYPDISGIQPAFGWAADYALHGRGPALHRRASELSRITSSRFGDASHSVTGAYLASRLLLRQHLGRAPIPPDEAFSFNS